MTHAAAPRPRTTTNPMAQRIALDLFSRLTAGSRPLCGSAMPAPLLTFSIVNRGAASPLHNSPALVQARQDSPRDDPQAVPDRTAAYCVVVVPVPPVVSETFPTGQLVFFRNLFAFGPIIIFMLSQGGLQFRTRHALGHLLRGLFGVSAMYCYFLSYKLLPLSDAVALGLSGPIFLTILSIPFLGERVGL